MVAAYNKFNQTVGDLAHGYHAWSTAAILKVMLSNTLPTSSMVTTTDITQISSGNGYTGGSLSGSSLSSVGGSSITITTSTQTGGIYKMIASALVFTAAGGTIGPFRYPVLYTYSTANVTGPLISWYDYGSSITLNDTETFTLTFDASSGVLQIT